MSPVPAPLSWLQAPWPWTLASALLSWGLMKLLLPLLRSRLLDHPNARSSHRRPTPRGGGVAFVVVSCGLAPLLAVGAVAGEGMPGAAPLAWLPLICAPLALTGFLDDQHDLPASVRYGIQTLTAIGLLGVAALPVPWWILPLAVIAITAVINFVNFMDGLDGLVAGCMAVLVTVAAVQLKATAPWSVVGALLGFLVWNWSPAKVFMGDVGSTFLGALFAGLVLQTRDPATAAGLLLVATPLLADALICVLRRAAERQPILQAHRLHLFQRLHQAGWSHGGVAALYIGCTAAGGVAFLGWGLAGISLWTGVTLAIGCWLDQAVAVPFRPAEANQRV